MTLTINNKFGTLKNYDDIQNIINRVDKECEIKLHFDSVTLWIVLLEPDKYAVFTYFGDPSEKSEFNTRSLENSDTLTDILWQFNDYVYNR